MRNEPQVMYYQLFARVGVAGCRKTEVFSLVVGRQRRRKAARRADAEHNMQKS